MIGKLLILFVAIGVFQCQEKFGNLTAQELSDIKKAIIQAESMYLPSTSQHTFAKMAQHIAQGLWDQETEKHTFWPVFVYNGNISEVSAAVKIPEDKWYYMYNKPEHKMSYFIWNNKKLRSQNPTYYHGPVKLSFGTALDKNDIDQIMNMISEAADKCGNNMTANAEYIRENLFDGEWEIMIFNPSTTFGGWVSQKMIGTGFFFAYLGSFGPYNWLYALYIPDYGTFKELRQE